MQRARGRVNAAAAAIIIMTMTPPAMAPELLPRLVWGISNTKYSARPRLKMSAGTVMKHTSLTNFYVYGNRLLLIYPS